MEQRLRNTTSKPTKFKGNHCLILQHKWTAMDSNGNWEQHQTAKEMLGSKFPLQLQTRRHDTKGVQRSGELRLENNEERRQLRTNAQTHNRNNKILQALQSTQKMHLPIQLQWHKSLYIFTAQNKQAAINWHHSRQNGTQCQLRRDKIQGDILQYLQPQQHV